mmetsp:Transcript_13435/g.15592  ORF Transcript_13435/g.15592 Transcript_13435/m.15592 type:complete len:459 (+) Transcript_13435:3632-5008(+)
MRKSVRSTLWGVGRAWGRAMENMPIQPGRVCAMVVKSVMAFHLVPNFLTGETGLGELTLLYFQVMRRAIKLPSTTGLLMLQTILPVESPLSWFSRMANNMVLRIERARPDLNFRFYWRQMTNVRYTSFGLFLAHEQLDRQGQVRQVRLRDYWLFFANDTRNLLVFATMNKFPGDFDRYKVKICECGKVFSKRHRIFCNVLPVKRFRAYSLEFFERYFTKGGFFNSAKWLKDGKEIWKRVQALETWELDETIPEEEWKKHPSHFTAANAPPGWIRRKYEQALRKKGGKIEYGEEWKAFAANVYNMDNLQETLDMEELENSIPDQICALHNRLAEPLDWQLDPIDAELKNWLNQEGERRMMSDEGPEYFKLTEEEKMERQDAKEARLRAFCALRDEMVDFVGCTERDLIKLFTRQELGTYGLLVEDDNDADPENKKGSTEDRGDNEGSDEVDRDLKLEWE